MGRVIPASHFIETFAADPTDTWVPDELREKIIDAVEKLPTELRDIVEMRLWAQRPYRKIASMLGYKSHASIIWKFREAMKILEEQLADEFNAARDS